MMNMNATLIGQLLVIFALIMGVLTYYLGRKKTSTPIIAGVLGALLSLMPLLGLIYAAALVLKSDVHQVTANEI